MLYSALFLKYGIFRSGPSYIWVNLFWISGSQIKDMECEKYSDGLKMMRPIRLSMIWTEFQKKVVKVIFSPKAYPL